MNTALTAALAALAGFGATVALTNVKGSPLNRNPSKRKGGVMLSEDRANIEKHLRQGDEVRGRTANGGYSRVYSIGSAYNLQVSDRKDFRSPTFAARVPDAGDASQVMRDISDLRQEMTWHRSAQTNPAKKEFLGREKFKEIERGRKWFDSLYYHQKAEMGDLLVLDDFDWRDWFDEKPSGLFMRGVDDARMNWEMTRWQG